METLFENDFDIIQDKFKNGHKRAKSDKNSSYKLETIATSAGTGKRYIILIYIYPFNY